MAKIPENIDYKYNFQMYLGFLKKYRGLIIFLLVLILFSEASYVFEKFLFKAVIDNGAEFVNNSLAKEAFVAILTTIAISFIGIIILRSIITFFRIHLINKLDAELIADLKRKYFNHILNLSHSFHTTHKTGSLISRLVRGGGAMERMTDVFVFNFIPFLFQIVVVSASLIYFDWVSSVIIFLTAGLFIGYNFIMQQVQKGPFVFANKIEDREKGTISDIFTNIDSVKYFAKEKIVEV